MKNAIELFKIRIVGFKVGSSTSTSSSSAFEQIKEFYVYQNFLNFSWCNCYLLGCYYLTITQVALQMHQFQFFNAYQDDIRCLYSSTYEHSPVATQGKSLGSFLTSWWVDPIYSF